MRESLIDFDRYVISIYGSIWNRHFKRFHSCYIGNNGYKQVRLTCKDGKTRLFCVHRVIAYYYLPNPDNKPTVNHINHIRTDNRIENLEWATYLEQFDDEWRKSVSKNVFQYTLDGNLVKIWQSSQETKKNGYNQGNVYECCRGKRKSHKGYRWSFFPL